MSLKRSSSRKSISDRHLSQSVDSGHKLKDRLFGRGGGLQNNHKDKDNNTSPVTMGGGSGGILLPIKATALTTRASMRMVRQIDSLSPEGLAALIVKANSEAVLRFPVTEIKKKQIDNTTTTSSSSSSSSLSSIVGGVAIYGMKVTRGLLFAPSQEKKLYIYDTNVRTLIL